MTIDVELCSLVDAYKMRRYRAALSDGVVAVSLLRGEEGHQSAEIADLVVLQNPTRFMGLDA